MQVISNSRSLEFFSIYTISSLRLLGSLQPLLYFQDLGAQTVDILVVLGLPISIRIYTTEAMLLVKLNRKHWENLPAEHIVEFFPSERLHVEA